MVAYHDRHELRPGHIVIYTRRGSVKKTYHARIKLDGVKKYIIRSLGTSNRRDAENLAEELFYDLRDKKKRGLDVTQATVTFAAAWKRFMNDPNVELSEHRRRLFEGTAERYFIEFFGNTKLATLTSEALERYFPWRKRVWQERKERDPALIRPNVSFNPKPKSLSMERGMLRQFLRWAVRKKLISSIPEIEAKKFVSPGKDDRRATFTEEEFLQLRKSLDRWCDEPTELQEITSGGRLHAKGPHRLHRDRRLVIRDYVILVARSGLRPGEARKLQWKHLRTVRDELNINVPNDTKTSSRTVVCMEGTAPIVDRIKKYSKYCLADDFVFPTKEGKQQTDFNQTFQKFLSDYDLLFDVHEKKRCIYSLRHFYATQKLIDGKTGIHDLAKNMGTSTNYIDKHYSHVISSDRADVLSKAGASRFAAFKKGAKLRV